MPGVPGPLQPVYIDDSITIKFTPLVIEHEGVRHVFMQIWAEGHFDDRKAEAWRLFCHIQEAQGRAEFVLPRIFKRDDMREGEPNCLACLADLPPGVL